MPTNDEITPAMIEAGIDAFCAVLLDMDPYEEIVSNIYRAMESARLRDTLLIADAPVLSDEYIRLGKPGWPTASNAIPHRKETDDR